MVESAEIPSSKLKLSKNACNLYFLGGTWITFNYIDWKWNAKRIHFVDLVYSYVEMTEKCDDQPRYHTKYYLWH